MLESHIQRALLVALNLIPRVWVWRQNTGALPTVGGRFIRFGRIGSADITGLVAGRRLEVEVKKSKGRLSPAQLDFGQRIESLGGVWLVCRGHEDVERVLGEVRELAI